MLDASTTGAIVLDEADRMLDMGFREDLEAILAFFPKDRSTHLVSATFPREVKALADRIQSNPAIVEGTPIGTANQDIEHLIHLVAPRERLAAIINLLLERAEGQTLIFARTRADVAELAELLGNEGFAIAMLSGEMEQAERNRALAAFKKGNMDALVATDVAARGIDVTDVTRVIHAEPPTDADAYTHRSGRTGRAGKKGISSILAAPGDLSRTTGLLSRARVKWQFAPVPTAKDLRNSQDERLFEMLTSDTGEEVDERSAALAARLLGAEKAIARLVSLVARRTTAEPRDITPIAPPSQQDQRFGRMERNRPERGRREERFDRGSAPPPPRDAWREDRGPRPERPERRDDAPRSNGGAFVQFHVSWGESHGADARRLVAMMCRRGQIEGRDIGAIRIGRTSSMIEVSNTAAPAFEDLATRPDPRDPRVRVRRWSDEPMTQRVPELPQENDDRSTVDAPPEERPSSRKLPKERPSVAKIPKDRPSVPKDRPSAKIPKDKPSVPKDTPSVPKDKPSVPKERPSVAKIPKDKPSVPKDRPSVPKIPKDKPSVPKDKPSAPKAPERTTVIRRPAKDPKDAPAPAGGPPKRPFTPKGRTPPPWAADRAVARRRSGGLDLAGALPLHPEPRTPCVPADGKRGRSGALVETARARIPR